MLLTGEISDELFGYKYTAHFAPGPEEFQKESEKRIRELYMYDVLRLTDVSRAMVLKPGFLSGTSTSSNMLWPSDLRRR